MDSRAAEFPVGSYWEATAGDAGAFPPFTGTAACDVVVVGAGFTGLSSAYHLKRQGYDCIVLEARQPGWGASGRNGGMVVPRFKATFPELAAKLGTDAALLLHEAAHAAVDTLEAVVRDCNIDCGFAKSGHLTPFAAGANVERFEADAEWLEHYAGDTAPQILSASECAEKLGTAFYAGAYYEPRGGGIHPLRYCLSLASRLPSLGVPVHGGSAVRAWRRERDELTVTTDKGTIRCRKLVLAMNGYSDTARGGSRLKRRIIPVVSSIIATEPLPDSSAAGILPDGSLATDAKRLTNYYRKFDDGRFLFGGRGGAGVRVSGKVYERLMQDAVGIYPQLEGVRPEYRWSGRVAVTLDGIPRIGLLEKGVYYAMGYNGRGVALANYMGRMLADAICGKPLLPAPIAGLSFPRIPFHSLRLPAKQAVMLWYKILDDLRG